MPHHRPLVPDDRRARRGSVQGDVPFEVTAGSLSLGWYGSLAWRSFAPRAPSTTDHTVLLAHGLLRNQDNMRGWAEAWASAGIPVVTVTLVRVGTPGTIAERNATDLVALAEHLGLSAVVHAGFSSGGLSALLAAARDPRARGVLLFDPAESGGTAARAAAGLRVPIAVFSSPGHPCNGGSAGAHALRPVARSFSVPAATHCWFEIPCSSLCGLACGRGDRALLGPTQAQLLTSTTALLQGWLAGNPQAPALEDGVHVCAWSPVGPSPPTTPSAGA